VKIVYAVPFEPVVQSRSILGLGLPNSANCNCEWPLPVHWNCLFVSNQGAFSLSRKRSISFNYWYVISCVLARRAASRSAAAAESSARWRGNAVARSRTVAIVPLLRPSRDDGRVCRNTCSWGRPRRRPAWTWAVSRGLHIAVWQRSSHTTPVDSRACTCTVGTVDKITILGNNKKHLKNVGPIRHCEPPHAACSNFTLPFTRCRYCRHHYQDEPKPAIAIAQAACDSSDSWW